MMQVIDLGLIDYDIAVLKQQEEVKAVFEERTKGALFLLEHPQVITLGRHGGGENLLASQDQLKALHIKLVQSQRGGNITCHYPGQLVGYPIFRLKPQNSAIHHLFFNLEEAVIRTVGDFGVKAQREEGKPGVWVDGRKICSIGIAVKHGITWHGISLNVSKDTSLFDLINLCGLRGAHPTSIALESGKEPKMHEVKYVFSQHFRTLLADTFLA